ncbi:MAG: hypothetical protein KTR15_07785 [Phycisphaeraceae bacterium]|nr:hypothetical protein [Phycisphaeraceae bacterium]
MTYPFRTPGTPIAANDQADPDSVVFGHPYDIIDAMMLFGAMLEPTKRGSRRVRLVLGRSMAHWPSLVWAVTTCWHNRITLRMKGGEFGIRNKLIFTSSGKRWLEHAMYRWYPEFKETGRRKATTPADLVIIEGMLVIWLVTVMSRASNRPQRIDDNGSVIPNDLPIYISCPRLSKHAADSLHEQLAPFVDRWNVQVKKGDAGLYRLQVPAKHYKDIEYWIRGAVDPQFWDRPEIMQAA